MESGKNRARRLSWIALAGGLALVPTVVLVLLLSHLRVLAEPTETWSVQKEASASQAGPGDRLTYTIRIRNTGAGVTAWMTDTLPDGLAYVGGSLELFAPGTAGAANDVITWTSAAFGWGQEAVITFSAQISPDVGYATIVNTAEVTGSGLLMTSPVSVEVKPGALEAAKSVFPTSAGLGEWLTYTIYITNVGNAVVDSAWITDDLPSEVDWAGTGALGAGGGSWGVANDVVTWTGALAPAEMVAIVFGVQVTSTLEDETPFTNSAEITGTGNLLLVTARATALTAYETYFPIALRNYPPIPVLNAIPEPDANNAYLVSWVLNDTPTLDHFVLQESTSSNFTAVSRQWTLTATSKYVENGLLYGDTLYYRVRADDGWGQGPWSNVRSVVLQINYYDSFTNSASGWTLHNASCCLGVCFDAREHLDYKYSLYYSGGRYHVNIPLDCRAGGNHGDTRHIYPLTFAPGVVRPTSRTCLQMEGSLENWDAYWTFWGLVFASSEDKTLFFALEVNNLGDWAVLKHSGYPYPGPNHPFFYETRTKLVDWTNSHRWPANAGFSTNRLRAEVNGQSVKLFVNGNQVYNFNDPLIPTLRRVGIMGGDWEIAPTQIGYDYFYLDEGCDTY